MKTGNVDIEENQFNHQSNKRNIYPSRATYNNIIGSGKEGRPKMIGNDQLEGSFFIQIMKSTW